MAAPVPSYITLLDDSTNTGKKIRTEARSVSGQTVHEHIYVPTTNYTVVGRYFYNSAILTVNSIPQDGVVTGSFWFQNPASSPVTMVVRSIVAEGVGLGTAASLFTVISFSRLAYTGTPTATIFSSTPCVTGSPVANVIIRNASTGMVFSSAAKLTDFCQFAIPSSLTAISTSYGSKIVYQKNPLAYVRGLDFEIAPGECMIVWQSTDGVGLDTRRFFIQFEWDEIDVS